MKNIILFGFMGSGKSAISKLLATHLNFKLLDIDSHIEKIEHKTIKKIFSLHGEKYFRELELNVFNEFKGQKNLIISLGGGFIANHDIDISDIKIYLECDFFVLRSRILNESKIKLLKYLNIKNIKLQNNKIKSIIFKFSNRPLFSDSKKALSLFNQRKDIYSKRADIVINANQNVNKVFLDIISVIKKKDYL